MMVSISGERGVGKTLHLAARVYQRRRQGYFVVTNFSHSHSNLDCSGLSPEQFLDVILNIIDFKDNGYEMFHLHPSFRHTGVYIAMDEATIYFSPEMQARLSKKNPLKYERLLNLLAQARKYDVEIDYVVQDPAKVGKDFRRYTEHYKRFRWVFKLKRLAYIPHPRLPIFRREHRHLLDFVWEEIHDLDAENPVFNYHTIRDENGIAQWAESSTLKERHLRTTGRYKKHILRMYNSYQPVAVKQEEYRKEFSPLKDFKIISGDFKKDPLPTFKRILKFLHIPVRRTDETLPPKVGFTDIVLPRYDARNKIISEVQNQEVKTYDVSELQKAIARAYSDGEGKRGIFTRKKKADNVTPVLPASYEEVKIGAESPEKLVILGEEELSGRKKYIKKNDPKELMRNKEEQLNAPISISLTTNGEDTTPKIKKRTRRKMEQSSTEGNSIQSTEALQKMPRKRKPRIYGSLDNVRVHEPQV